MSNRNLDNLFKSIGGVSARGYSGGVSVSRTTTNSNSGIHGLFSFNAEAGRKYKVNVSIPIGCGATNTKTRVYARAKFDGTFIDEGVAGCFWGDHSESSGTCMGYISMSPIADNITDKSVEVLVYFDSTVADTLLMEGRVFVEDIGPL